MKISEKIKKLRLSKGLSQQEVADKLGISKNGYGSIERGETSLNSNLGRLEQLAKIFGVDISTFFDPAEQTIFNLAETHNQNNWHINHSSGELYHELEKFRLLVERQSKEIELLKQQNADLRTIISLLKKEQPE